MCTYVCRYGLDDFAEISAILAAPFTTPGAPQSQQLHLALWRRGIALVQSAPEQHTEMLTYGLRAFVPALGAAAAAEVMQLFEDKVQVRFAVLRFAVSPPAVKAIQCG